MSSHLYDLSESKDDVEMEARPVLQSLFKLQGDDRKLPWELVIRRARRRDVFADVWTKHK